ncbi:unnamed protein product [Arctia plantaginis]|uniref:Uncharacterized protein n=1 Tax=Arctia plantaginis TaxID=874455 RepID=A0A8S1B096_ARCPL|nr:unnamed protein product [Arctia plantaginis]
MLRLEENMKLATEAVVRKKTGIKQLEFMVKMKTMAKIQIITTESDIFENGYLPVKQRCSSSSKMFADYKFIAADKEPNENIEPQVRSFI